MPGASQDVSIPTTFALSFDINWVTVTQVSRSHSPVFDLAVRHSDEVYLQYVVESRTELFVVSC